MVLLYVSIVCRRCEIHDDVVHRLHLGQKFCPIVDARQCIVSEFSQSLFVVYANLLMSILKEYFLKSFHPLTNVAKAVNPTAT